MDTIRPYKKYIDIVCFFKLQQEGIEKEIKQLTFCVLNWNTASIKFYKNRGAFDMTVRDNLHVFRVENPQPKTDKNNKL